MILQPSDERRRSGSHYTPRSLTEPIVRTTLRPRAGAPPLARIPTPDQILELNVCDPAMGSGAFLVEACRQLGDELVKAWHVHNQVPKLPPDEDEILHARRLIAQRCLYGVDRNPMAVDLAKLSLWLATLAKDHPFTFLDHTLRAGDSLVGLSKKQIAAFHWAAGRGDGEAAEWVSRSATRSPSRSSGRRSFGRESWRHATRCPTSTCASSSTRPTRQWTRPGSSATLSWRPTFPLEKDKARQERLRELALRLVKYLGPGGKMEDRQPLAEAVQYLRSGDRPVPPFHWEIEFPEPEVRPMDFPRNSRMNLFQPDSVPLVLGTPVMRESGATDIRKARAADLKIASAMWWVLRPWCRTTCRLARALAAKACQKSATSSLSKSPILAVGNSAWKTKRRGRRDPGPS